MPRKKSEAPIHPAAKKAATEAQRTLALARKRELPEWMISLREDFLGLQNNDGETLRGALDRQGLLTRKFIESVDAGLREPRATGRLRGRPRIGSVYTNGALAVLDRSLTAIESETVDPVCLEVARHIEAAFSEALRATHSASSKYAKFLSCVLETLPEIMENREYNNLVRPQIVAFAVPEEMESLFKALPFPLRPEKEERVAYTGGLFFLFLGLAMRGFFPEYARSKTASELNKLEKKCRALIYPLFEGDSVRLALGTDRSLTDPRQHVQNSVNLFLAAKAGALCSGLSAPCGPTAIDRIVREIRGESRAFPFWRIRAENYLKDNS